MANEIEWLLNALLNGESIDDFTPNSRMEEYLYAALKNQGAEGLPIPRSRIDALLYDFAQQGIGDSALPAQEKTVTPSTTEQVVTADAGHRLSKVTVNVPDKPFINTAGMTNFNGFFFGNGRLDQLDKVDFSDMIKCDSIFRACKDLTEDPLFVINEKDIDPCTNIFNGCTNLKIVKNNRFEKFGNMSSGFANCTSLEEVDTYINGYNYNDLFNGCTALRKVATIDCTRVLACWTMFKNCTNLTELTLLNIKKSIQIGSGEIWGHLLTVDSLINTIKELVNTGEALTLTMGSINKEKIADIWCVVTDDTTTKMSIEIVDAGTEGAITLEDFAFLKGWSIT